MHYDIIVIGAGMAGASVAAHLTKTCRVAVIEMEERPGYHSTGRSAALFSEIYGNEVIRALSRASLSFFHNPSAQFSEVSLLRPRGALYIAREDQLDSLAALSRSHDVARSTTPLSTAQAIEYCPILRDSYVAAALFEPDAMDIDVDALHQGYIRRFRAAEAQLLLGRGIVKLERRNGLWHCCTGAETFSAPIVVNAAGAWADRIAQLAGARSIGLTSCRRSAALVPQPDDRDLGGCPIVIDIDEQFYFKPDAGALLISPCDEDPVEPCDVQPDDFLLAVAVDRVQQSASLDVRRLISRWAGLRNFVADRTPVVGYDPAVEGFFWLAGQGGYGIQTAPALSEVAAALVEKREVGGSLVDEWVIAAMSPARASLRAVSAVSAS